MHITRLQAAVSHGVPLTHALDIAHNNELRRAEAARNWAIIQIRKRGLQAHICKECLEANLNWYKKAFDASIEQLKTIGTCRTAPYAEYESPCWAKPETGNGALA